MGKTTVLSWSRYDKCDFDGCGVAKGEKCKNLTRTNSGVPGIKYRKTPHPGRRLLQGALYGSQTTGRISLRKTVSQATKGR